MLNASSHACAVHARVIGALCARGARANSGHRKSPYFIGIFVTSAKFMHGDERSRRAMFDAQNTRARALDSARRYAQSRARFRENTGFFAAL
jgi:hypothetical protein